MFFQIILISVERKTGMLIVLGELGGCRDNSEARKRRHRLEMKPLRKASQPILDCAARIGWDRSSVTVVRSTGALAGQSQMAWTMTDVKLRGGVANVAVALDGVGEGLPELDGYRMSALHQVIERFGVGAVPALRGHPGL